MPGGIGGPPLTPHTEKISRKDLAQRVHGAERAPTIMTRHTAANTNGRASTIKADYPFKANYVNSAVGVLL